MQNYRKIENLVILTFWVALAVLAVLAFRQATAPGFFAAPAPATAPAAATAPATAPAPAAAGWENTPAPATVTDPVCLSELRREASGMTESEMATDCQAPAPAEDSPGWNCETQGNRICGPIGIRLDPAGTATVTTGTGTLAVVPAGSVTYLGDFGSFAVADYVAQLDDCGAHTGTLGVTILAAAPSAVAEGITRAAVVGREGNCLAVVGTVTLY